MSETLRDLVVSLSLQSDNFTRNIRSVNKQIQEAESYFKLAAAGVEGFENSTEGLTSKLSTLERRLSLQKDAVTQYEKALTAANNKLQECYDRQVDYAQRLEDARKAQQALKDQVKAAASQVKTFSSTLGESDSATIAAKANLDQLKTEYKASVQEVKKLAGQNTALKKSTQNAADAVSTATANLNKAKAAIKSTESEIGKCNRALSLSETGWDSAGETIKETQSALTTIGKQMQLAESRFKFASAGIKEMDKSAEGLSARLVLLNDKLKLQQDSVVQYEKALEAAKEQLAAAQSVNDPEKVRQATDAVIDAESALTKAQAAVKQTKADIESCTKSLKTAQSAWTSAGKTLESFGKKCDTVSKSMTTAGRTLSTVMTAPIVALGTTAVKSSISFESAFTSVRKTVDATEEEFTALSDDIKTMSTQIATSADDIAEVVAIAGQLGIANEHLMGFGKTMIDLGNSTDIVAEEAASTLAKFANITQMNQSEFQNLGSALVDLGNNYATTESAIMEMSMRLAAAGHQVGLSESQILGFATALSSVGIEAEMGGSAFSKALIKMEVAAETGGEALEDFAKVSDMTEDEFKKLWKSNPAGAFQAFIVGLSKMDEEGESAIATLNDIGIAEVRLRDTLLRSVNATELFEETQQTANKAWEENVALTEEAGKRYATTESKLINLKNKATLFAQQIGNDLNPTIQDLISGADELLDKFMDLDESQRKQIIQFAAIAAAAGPALLAFGKVTKGVGSLVTGIGKFSTAVGKAGGGWKGFMSVLSKSPAVWMAVAAAVIAGTVALVDYVSGAKKAREAMEGMNETAQKWKDTAADTFYGKSEGLSFFGMSEADFTRETQTAQEWLDGLITVWTDGKKETNEIVSEWTESFKNLTASTRTELEELKATADDAGYSGVSEQIESDIEQLDKMDAEITKLIKRRQNGYFSEKDKIRLQELIDAREAIEVKYNLSPVDADGFDTIRQKLEAEVARANARGKDDAGVSVYENAMVAAAEGMAAMNAQIDAQYDKEYQLIQLMTDAGEKQIALDELNARYNANRRSAAMEYAALMADVVMPVWEQENIQQAATDVGTLTQKLREYSAATETEKPAILEDINAITAAMDEGALTEYVTVLTQIQSLLDSGMTEGEVEAMFPEIDFSTALEQIASIQSFLNQPDVELPALSTMFGEAVPEEVLTIATDLDMTGAQTRWDEFAANPGAITTEAVISGYTENEETIKLQPTVDAFIAKYTEVEEGADTASLTPEGLVAYVATYAEATTGTDVSALNPTNVTAMVAAYEELASGADITTLKPDEITAYIFKYLEKEGVDTTALKPDAVTAFVMAYEEIEGGALKTEITPDDITAYIYKYMEKEGVDTSSLNPNTVTAMVAAYEELAEGTDISKLKPEDIVARVGSYLEATGVDTSQLAPGALTAFVSAYQEIEGGALTSSLTPDDVTAMVVKYLEAENVDVSALSSAQVEAIVTAFAEATGCDKSQLLQNFVAHITAYDDTGAVRPSFSMSIGISGYDLIAYRKFIANNPVEVQGIVRLSEVYEDPNQALLDPQTVFWQDGQKIPVEAVPTEMLTADKVAVLDEDGTLHVLIAPEITGAEEAIAQLKTEVEEVDQLGTTVVGNWAGVMPSTTMDFIDAAIERIRTFNEQKGTFWQLWGFAEEGALKTLDNSMKTDFDPDTIAGLSTYVGEIVAAIQQGKQVSEEDLTNLQTILTFLQELDTTEVGDNVLQGVADGMTAAGWDTDAETVAANLETALNKALQIESPSQRVKPIGEYVSAGVGSGMTGYDFTTDATTMSGNLESAVSTALTADTLSTVATGAMDGLALAMTGYGMSSTGATIASNVKSAVSTSLTSATLRSVGVNAMAGLKAGINAGKSGVVSAMRAAAKAAVSAAKSQLKIASPSRVFEDEVGVMTMRGFGEGVLKESKEQAKIIRNASRYLTDEARSGAIAYNSSDNRRTYNNNVSSTIQVRQMVVRDEQDIRSLAVEIAALTRREQRGKGLRMA